MTQDLNPQLPVVTPPPAITRPKRSLLHRFIRKTIRLIVIGYVSACVFVYFAQEYLLFPGAAYHGSAEAVMKPLVGTEMVHLVSAAGDQITALYGPALLNRGRADPEAGTRQTIVYFYGNGSFIAGSLGEFEQFRELGVNVLMPDYPGYGMSSGKPTEAGMYAAADAAYDYLVKTRGCEPRRIISAGWSMGGAVAIDLASRREVGGLALFNAFTSMRDMASYTLPWLPARWLLKYPFDNAGKIGGIKCPTVICNGLQDEIVPPEMSDRLMGMAGGKVTRVKVAAASHNTIFSASPDEVFGAMGEFLKKCD